MGDLSHAYGCEQHGCRNIGDEQQRVYSPEVGWVTVYRCVEHREAPDYGRSSGGVS